MLSLVFAWNVLGVRLFALQNANLVLRLDAVFVVIDVKKRYLRFIYICHVFTLFNVFLFYIERFFYIYVCR